MRIRPVSDLHLEHNKFLKRPEEEVDITLLGGDIFTKEHQLPSDDLCDFFRSKVVVAVAGNHEYYHKKMDTYLPLLRDIYAKRNAILLENDILTLSDDCSEKELCHMGTTPVTTEGFRIIGGTLWTDFRLFAGDDTYQVRLQASKVVGENIYSKGMNDFWLIRQASRNYRKFRPKYAAMFHKETRDFIEQSLRLPFNGIKYVLTHHAPAFMCIPDDKKEDVFSIAYASRLEDMILDTKPDFWQYGHIHHAVPELTLGNTEFISNPRGYPGKPSFMQFDLDSVIQTVETPDLKIPVFR